MSKEENQNIEELANEIAFIFVNKCNKDGIKYETIAEDLCNAGYRKQVWHKVADGDLPALGKLVLTVYKDIRGLQYRIDYITLEQNFDNIDELNLVWRSELNANCGYFDKVIAWTELPEYEEE